MFGLFEKEWSYDSVPDMTGKICLVTGGSSGLGRQSCLELAKKGASVYVIGRDQKKTMKAIKDIINETSNQNIHFLKADFMDLESVCAMADAFLAKDVPLHLLLNNAGSFHHNLFIFI